MMKLRQLTLAVLLSQPLALGAEAAFAFSLGDATMSTDGAAGLADPDAQFDGLADHLSPKLDNPQPDFSETLMRSEAEPDSAGMPARPALSGQLPRLGNNRQN
jgi:hypothetical protein